MGSTNTQYEAVNDHVSIFYLCGYVTSLPRHNTYTRVSFALETVAPHVMDAFYSLSQDKAMQMEGTKNKRIILIRF